MATLWEIGLANALVVAIVAPLAFVLARAAKRPAWVHAVWVVVLLKLVTPPVASWPVSWSRAARVESVAAVPVEVEAAEVVVKRPSRPVAMALADVVEAAPIALPLKRAVSLPVVLGSIWVMGSGLWVMVAAWRIARFARAARRAEDAPGDLIELVGELSRQIGLKRAPRVVMAPVRVAPMVWALGGRACLLVPEALWDRLDGEQRAAMLVHELAHLRRRDHWVRILELAATGLYWWHPALWLARRELRRAEEECCDLWVVWALPKAKRTYASALVEAVEFLSEARPKGLPIGASGMGQVEDLSRRIGMIMRGDTPRGLTRAGTLAAIGLGLLLLPWRPTIAQDAPKGEVVTPAADAPKATEEEAELARLEKQVKWAEEMVKNGYVSRKQLETDKAVLAKFRARLNLNNDEGEDAFAAARAQVRAAMDEEQRAQTMAKSGAASSRDVGAAQAEVLKMKAVLASLEAQARKDAEAHQLAIQEAKDAVETADGNLRTHAARVAKAEAQRQGPSAVLARLTQLTASGAVTISELAKAKAAKADMAVADAVVEEAKAERDQAGIEVKQSQRRLAAIETQATLVAVPSRATTKRNMRTAAALTLKAVAEHQLAKTAPVEELAKPIPRDANARIDELEAKLDRVLKELEAMRKPTEGKPAPKAAAVVDAAPATLGFSYDNALKDEDIVRALYDNFVGLQPNEEELVRALAIFDDAASRTIAVYDTIMRITPAWKEGQDDAFANALAERKSLNNAMVVELAYSKILSRNPTRGEIRERAYALKNGADRRKAIRSLVKEVVKMPKNGGFQ